jgi:hypothetical protein
MTGILGFPSARDRDRDREYENNKSCSIYDDTKNFEAVPCSVGNAGL